MRYIASSHSPSFRDLSLANFRFQLLKIAARLQAPQNLRQPFRRRSQLAFDKIQPTPRTGDPRDHLSGLTEKLVPETKARSIGAETRKLEVDTDEVQEAHFPEVLELIPQDDGTHPLTFELSHRESLLGEIHHPDIPGDVQVRRIFHVRIEIHVSPAHMKNRFKDVSQNGVPPVGSLPV
jgi:hypothetical protein